MTPPPLGGTTGEPQPRHRRPILNYSSSLSVWATVGIVTVVGGKYVASSSECRDQSKLTKVFFRQLSRHFSEGFFSISRKGTIVLRPSNFQACSKSTYSLHFAFYLLKINL